MDQSLQISTSKVGLKIYNHLRVTLPKCQINLKILNKIIITGEEGTLSEINKSIYHHPLKRFLIAMNILLIVNMTKKMITRLYKILNHQ